MIKKLKLGFVIIRDSILNLFLKTELHYIVEPEDWVIRWEGKQIINELKKTYKMKCKLTSSTIFMKSKIVIYGSINSLLSKHAIIKKNKINVLTLYHIVDKNPKIKKILKHQDKINIFHTACEITKKKLIKLGIPKEKIILIPEGIDLKAFNPKIESIKEKLKLPKDHIIIGSFQKDGVGWDEGLKPKMEKGPDILIEAIEGISKKVKVHILLTGPSRGYVKNELKKRNISYTHVFLKDFLDIPKYYRALDLYIVSSREEGGPKAILESMASGIPIISTKVGMAPDIIIDGKNGMLCDVGNTKQIISKSLEIINSNNSLMVIEGLKTAKFYDWNEIAKLYYEKIIKRMKSL